jgi:hypothetical protein
VVFDRLSVALFYQPQLAANAIATAEEKMKTKAERRLFLLEAVAEIVAILLVIGFIRYLIVHGSHY